MENKEISSELRDPKNTKEDDYDRANYRKVADEFYGEGELLFDLSECVK